MSSSAMNVRPSASVRSKMTTAGRCDDGSRLIFSTNATPYASSDASCSPAGFSHVAPPEAGCHDKRWAHVAQVLRRKIHRVIRGALKRISDRDGQPKLLAEERVDVRQARRTAAEDDRLDHLAAEPRAEVVERLMDLRNELGERGRDDV